MKEKIKSLEQQLIVAQQDTQLPKEEDEIGMDMPLEESSQLNPTTSLWDWNVYLLWNQCMDTGYFLPDTSINQFTII